MTPEEIEKIRSLHEDFEFSVKQVARHVGRRKAAVADIIRERGFVHGGRARHQKEAFEQRMWVNLVGYLAAVDVKVCAFFGNRVRKLDQILVEPLPLPASPTTPHRIVARSLEPVIEEFAGADSTIEAIQAWASDVLTEWKDFAAKKNGEKPSQRGFFLLGGGTEELKHQILAHISSSNWIVMSCPLPEFSRRVADILSDYRLEKLGTGNFPSRVCLLNQLTRVKQSRWVLGLHKAVIDYAEEETTMRAMARDGAVFPGPSSRIAAGREVLIVDGAAKSRVTYGPPLAEGKDASPKLLAPSVLMSEAMEILSPEQTSALRLRHNDWQSLPKNYVGWAKSEEFPEGILVVRLSSLQGMMYEAIRRYAPETDLPGLTYVDKALSCLPEGRTRQVIGNVATAVTLAVGRFCKPAGARFMGMHYCDLARQAKLKGGVGHNLQSGVFIHATRSLLLNEVTDEEWIQRLVVATMLRLVDADTLLRHLTRDDGKKVQGWKQEWVNAIRVELTKWELTERKKRSGSKDNRSEWDDSTVPQDALDRFADGHSGFPRLVLEALYVQTSLKFQEIIRAGWHQLPLFQLAWSPFVFLRAADAGWPTVGIKQEALISQFLNYRYYALKRVKAELSSPEEDKEGKKKKQQGRSVKAGYTNNLDNFTDSLEEAEDFDVIINRALGMLTRMPVESLGAVAESLVAGVAEQKNDGRIESAPVLRHAEKVALNEIFEGIAEEGENADFERAEREVTAILKTVHSRLSLRQDAPKDSSGG